MKRTSKYNNFFTYDKILTLKIGNKKRKVMISSFFPLEYNHKCSIYFQNEKTKDWFFVEYAKNLATALEQLRKRSS